MKHVFNHRTRVLTLCSLAWFLIFSAGLLPGVVLPVVQRELALSLTQAGFPITMLWLFHALTQFPAGILADRLGRKLIIALGLLVFAAGSFITGTSSEYTVLLLAFIVLGIGMGTYPSAGTTLLAETFGRQKGRAFGLHSAVSTLGGLVPLAVPLLIPVLGWRKIYGGFGLLALPLAAAFLFFHQRLNTGLHGVRNTLPSFRKILSNRSVRLLLPLTVLFVGAWLAVTSFLPTYLVREKGLSLGLSGIIYSAIFFAGIVTRPLVGVLSDRLDRRRLLLVACIFGAAGNLIVIVSRSLSGICLAIVCFSICGCFFLIKNGYLLDLLPRRRAATYLGLFNTMIAIVASQSSVLIGALGDRYSLTHGFAVLAALMTTSGLLTLLLKQPKQTLHHSRTQQRQECAVYVEESMPDSIQKGD